MVHPVVRPVACSAARSAAHPAVVDSAEAAVGLAKAAAGRLAYDP